MVRTSKYGIENLVLMMGLLQTEIGFLSVIVDTFENSQWTTLIQNNGVTRSGAVQSLLSRHQIVRTKYSHQVTVCALLTLMQKDYNH